MNRADVADKLLNNHGLANAGSAICSDLAAFGERGDQVHDLDAGFQNLHLSGLVFKGRRVAVDGPMELGVHLFQIVQRLTERVE